MANSYNVSRDHYTPLDDKDSMDVNEPFVVHKTPLNPEQPYQTVPMSNAPISPRVARKRVIQHSNTSPADVSAQ